MSEGAGGNSAVEASVVGIRRDRPPLAKLLLDVTLRNDRAEQRWFLLPEMLGGSPVPRERGIFGVDPVEVRGEGRAVVAAFRGAEGFQALLLPGGAEVRVRGLPLAHLGRLPSGAAGLEVAIATSLEIGGEPAGDWIGSDPLSDRSVDADYEHARRLPSRYTPHYADVPAVVAEEARLSVTFALPSAPPVSQTE